ncbi:MAG: hypothetical protein GY710_12245 [Desulfobacteraceae bacterium]|nr:hypothetical protein [Desulfobacteraceae bacterium]
MKLNNIAPIIALLFLISIGFFAYGYIAKEFKVFPYQYIEHVYLALKGTDVDNKTVVDRLVMHPQVRCVSSKLSPFPKKISQLHRKISS